MEPQIRFCTSADGTRIAYATMGEGPPLLHVDTWSMLPIERGFYAGVMTQGRRVVLLDNRGTGSSQRDVEEISVEAQALDLAAVADELQLDRFDLWGDFDGAPVAIKYAAQHPERVSRLVLSGPYSHGGEVSPPESIRSLAELVRNNWGVARRTLAAITFPKGPLELQRLFSDIWRESVSPDVAARYVELFTNVDVRPLLPRVSAPTLVLHPRGEFRLPASAIRAVASQIPNARLATPDGPPNFSNSNLVKVIAQFLDEGRGGSDEEASAEAAPPAAGDVHTILFTDIESSTATRRRLGDAKAQEVLRAHNTIVRDALQAHGGSEIKHTGDGIMASFPSASGALKAAIAIQRAVAAHAEQHPDAPLGVYIGLNAGEPIAEEQDLFGTAVDLARRICDNAQPDEILVSDVVRQLAAGKDFLFADQGDVALRGFEDPVRLYEVRWREDG